MHKATIVSATEVLLTAAVPTRIVGVVVVVVESTGHRTLAPSSGATHGCPKSCFLAAFPGDGRASFLVLFPPL